MGDEPDGERQAMSRLPLLRIVSNLPRSGGTLIGRCLGCMEGMVLLSEIHPRGAAIDERFDPLLQACHWHQLFAPRELPASRPPFVEGIEMIAQICAERGRQLLIRDWAYLDYMGVPYISAPPRRSQLEEQLAQRFTIRQHYLVRHPLELWLSLCGGRIVKQYLSVEDYLEGYLSYARVAAAGRFMRYEDFLQRPREELAHCCHHLQLDFDAAFMEKWGGYRNITGDYRSIGEAQSVIRPYQPKSVPAQLLERFQAVPAYGQALQLLGYDT